MCRVVVADPLRHLVAGKLDHRFLAERPCRAGGIPRVGTDFRLAVATGPLEQVLEPIRVRTLETEAPRAAWPLAGELDPSRTSQLVQERDVRERSVRVGKRELDGVLVNARPTHVFENTCHAESEITCSPGARGPLG